MATTAAQREEFARIRRETAGACKCQRVWFAMNRNGTGMILRKSKLRTVWVDCKHWNGKDHTYLECRA